MRVREHEVQEMNIVPTPSHPHPSPLPEGEGIYSEVARSTKPTSPSGVQTGDIAYTRSGTSLTRVRGHRLHIIFTPYAQINFTSPSGDCVLLCYIDTPQVKSFTFTFFPPLPLVYRPETSLTHYFYTVRSNQLHFSLWGLCSPSLYRNTTS